MSLDRYSMDPGKRELIRDLSDIMMRFMFYCCEGDVQYMVREASRYYFMWDTWIEAIYSGYGNPPEPESHRELIEPRWFREWQDRHP